MCKEHAKTISFEQDICRCVNKSVNSDILNIWSLLETTSNNNIVDIKIIRWLLLIKIILKKVKNKLKMSENSFNLSIDLFELFLGKFWRDIPIKNSFHCVVHYLWNEYSYNSYLSYKITILWNVDVFKIHQLKIYTILQ